MTERCGACGTDGVTNSAGRFVTNDWLRASELKAECDRLRKIEAAARNLCTVKGRHHSEIAMRGLMEACGIERPNVEITGDPQLHRGASVLNAKLGAARPEKGDK